MVANRRENRQSGLSCRHHARWHIEVEAYLASDQASIGAKRTVARDVEQVADLEALSHKLPQAWARGEAPA